MKEKQIIGIGIIGCIAVGVAIGFFARGAASRAPSPDPHTHSNTRSEAELTKLAVAAGAIQTVVDQTNASSRRQRAESPAAMPSSASAERPITARQERDAHVARLQESGPAPPEFTATVREVENEWRGLARAAHVEVEATPWRCYRSGCYSTGTFKDANDIDVFATRLSNSKGSRSWPGATFRSGPIPASQGSTEVTWVFFAPESQDPG
jgi:hypothetical protein